jgi:hypothetical protein
MPEETLFDALNRAAGESVPSEILPEISQPTVTLPIEPAKPQPQALTADAAARLKAIETQGTPEYQRWMSGDKQINDERISLYESKFPRGQKMEIT